MPLVGTIWSCDCHLTHHVVLATLPSPPQAYRKMNKDLKKEEIELLKTKYGIDLEKDK